jgi:hypothetical protein
MGNKFIARKHLDVHRATVRDKLTRSSRSHGARAFDAPLPAFDRTTERIRSTQVRKRLRTEGHPIYPGAQTIAHRRASDQPRSATDGSFDGI